MARKKHGSNKGSAPNSPAVTSQQADPSVEPTSSSPVKKKAASPNKKVEATETAEQPTSIRETSVEQPTSFSIVVSFGVEKIDHALKRRKSLEEIHDAGILKTEEDVEKMANITEQMAEKIDSRPSQDEMLRQNEHIVNPTGASRRLSGSLASTAKELEKHITSDKIDRHLAVRPDVESLEKSHVINTHVAPQLQSVQKKLQRQMSSDELSHRLDARPDVQELRDHGIVLGDGVAPSLTATAKKLERNLVQNQVSHLLESRPQKDELVTHHILEDPDAAVAPMLQGPKHQLERQLKADTIARQLRKRPSISELEKKGIIDEGEIGDTQAATKLSLSRRARYTLALKAATRIAADNLITPVEKSRLKDLILSDDEKVLAAIECYEMDQDIEEMLDTLYRVAKLA